MIVEAGPVVVHTQPLRRTVTIELPGHLATRIPRRGARTILHDLQRLLEPQTVADTAYGFGDVLDPYGAGRTWLGDIYIVIAGQRYTLDNEWQAEQLLRALHDRLERSPWIPAAPYTLLISAGIAVLVATDAATLWLLTGGPQ